MNPIDFHQNLSKMTTQKFCVLPGQLRIKLTTTLGGHTVLIDETPRHIPAIFQQQALGKGALTDVMVENLKRNLGVDEEPKLPEVPNTTPSSTPGMDVEIRFDKIKTALLPIVIAGRPEDFTTQGVPQVGSVVSGKGLSGACGFDVTASERDAAYDIVKDHPDVLALK
jgi:hypothetical protein